VKFEGTYISGGTNIGITDNVSKLCHENVFVKRGRYKQITEKIEKCAMVTKHF
jgi:hypothetical protein